VEIVAGQENGNSVGPFFLLFYLFIYCGKTNSVPTLPNLHQ
jgi:hypothetical protein